MANAHKSLSTTGIAVLLLAGTGSAWANTGALRILDLSGVGRALEACGVMQREGSSLVRSLEAANAVAQVNGHLLPATISESSLRIATIDKRAGLDPAGSLDYVSAFYVEDLSATASPSEYLTRYAQSAFGGMISIEPFTNQGMRNVERSLSLAAESPLRSPYDVGKVVGRSMRYLEQFAGPSANTFAANYTTLINGNFAAGTAHFIPGRIPGTYMFVLTPAK